MGNNSLESKGSTEQKKGKTSLYGQGLENFYKALVAAERAQQQKSVLPESKSHESLYRLKNFKNGGFLVSGPTSLTYPLFNVVVTTEVTQDIVKEVRAIFRPDKIPHTFIVDAGDMQGQEPLQKSGYKLGGSYIEMVVDASKKVQLPGDISPLLLVERVQNVEHATDEDKEVWREQCAEWAGLITDSPGFSIESSDLLKEYDRFHSHIEGPELLTCVEKVEFNEDYCCLKGAMSSYLSNGTQIILALSTKEQLDAEVMQKMVYESLCSARKVDPEAKAVYLGTEEEFEILQKLGFEKQRELFIYTK